MVEGSMVRNTLDAGMISSGQSLIEELISNDLQLSAALWFYFTDADIWRLVIASPIVKSKGPRAMYEKVQAIIRSASDQFPNLELSDVTVVSPDDNIVTQFKSAIQITGISGVRFSNNTVNGRVIDDSYIYKMTYPSKSS